MALTKVTKTGITDNAIDGDKIEDGTVVAADIAPGTISNDKIATGTIANDKLANSSVTINNTAVSLGSSLELSTGTDWQAVTVADGSTTLNAEAGKGYFLDTNAGVIEVFLPSSPTRGDKVILADYSGTFATNQIIINTGGELLDSTAGNDFKVTTNNSIVELVYVDSAKGWLVKLNQAAGTTPSGATSVISTFGSIYNSDNVAQFTEATGGTITTSGDFKIHTFTGDGCFVVSQVGSDSIFPGCASAGPDAVDYLIVAGGGSGANGRGGGGGGGGYRFGSTSSCTGLTISATTYPVTVGGGGSAPNSNGSNSIFSTITSAGGGYGLGLNGNGNPGGSGGGGGAFGGAFGGPKVGGTGNTPPVSPPQGNNGGDGNPTSWPSIPNGKGLTGGGGGGAGAAGNSVGPSNANGGAGSSSHQPIFGSNPQPYYIPDGNFSGGGGGASCGTNGGQTGSGGSGGGGNGNSGGAGSPGTANSGGGGGGSNCAGPGGNGGKGIVLIRYKFQ